MQKEVVPWWYVSGRCCYSPHGVLAPSCGVHGLLYLDHFQTLAGS